MPISIQLQYYSPNVCLHDVPRCLQTQMRDQEQKLRKVKAIVTKDSCHTPVQPVRSATALETNSIHARLPLSQNSKRVCTSN